MVTKLETKHVTDPKVTPLKTELEDDLGSTTFPSFIPQKYKNIALIERLVLNSRYTYPLWRSSCCPKFPTSKWPMPLPTMHFATLHYALTHYGNLLVVQSFPPANGRWSSFQLQVFGEANQIICRPTAIR